MADNSNYNYLMSLPSASIGDPSDPNAPTYEQVQSGMFYNISDPNSDPTDSVDQTWAYMNSLPTGQNSANPNQQQQNVNPPPPISAGTLTGAFGDIVSGIGGFMEGQEEAGADQYNASLALMTGGFNEEQIGLQEGETLSTQKAIYARSGVEQSGSTLDTALNTATNFEYDKQVASFNAQSQANMDTYEAKVAKQQGGFALGAGIAEAGVSIGLALL